MNTKEMEKKIINIIVSSGDDVYDYKDDKNVINITGPFKDEQKQIFWRIETKDKIIREYSVISVEYEKERECKGDCNCQYT